jgi:hypothetical protein
MSDDAATPIATYVNTVMFPTRPAVQAVLACADKITESVFCEDLDPWLWGKWFRAKEDLEMIMQSPRQDTFSFDSRCNLNTLYNLRIKQVRSTPHDELCRLLLVAGATFDVLNLQAFMAHVPYTQEDAEEAWPPAAAGHDATLEAFRCFLTNCPATRVFKSGQCLLENMNVLHLQCLLEHMAGEGHTLQGLLNAEDLALFFDRMLRSSLANAKCVEQWCGGRLPYITTQDATTGAFSVMGYTEERTELPTDALTMRKVRWWFTGVETRVEDRGGPLRPELRPFLPGLLITGSYPARSPYRGRRGGLQRSLLAVVLGRYVEDDTHFYIVKDACLPHCSRDALTRVGSLFKFYAARRKVTFLSFQDNTSFGYWFEDDIPAGCMEAVLQTNVSIQKTLKRWSPLREAFLGVVMRFASEREDSYAAAVFDDDGDDDGDDDDDDDDGDGARKRLRCVGHKA